MHGSVLQNDKYIGFADENTVEVIALQRLQEGIDEKDRKAETYKAKDGREYLVEFPNLTVAEMLALDTSKAGSYNNTGKIPYTAIVDPHNEAEINNLKGGYGAKALMEAVKEARKQLEAEHGPSLSRKDLRSFEEPAAEIRAATSVPKAVADALALQQKSEKKPEAIRAKAAQLVEEQLGRAGKELDRAEELLGAGSAKEAQKVLAPLARALKGTALEERANELIEKSKGA